MTAEQEAGLRELSAELASAQNSTKEPRCVARAFARPSSGELVLTMQAWVELAAIDSPLLEDALPQSLEDLEAAASIFGLSVLELDADPQAETARAMRDAVRAGFALVLPMRPPNADSSPVQNDGFGTWLPLHAFLVTQCGLSLAEAAEEPVVRTFGLMAAHRRNQGWEIAGTSYALRDIGREEPPEAPPSPPSPPAQAIESQPTDAAPGDAPNP